MKIGYARVSTLDQNLTLQEDALNGSGCEIVFTEKVTGKTKDRPKLNELFGKVRDGDTVVVWKLDRLARSLKDLIDLVSRLQSAGANLISLQDNIDTSTAAGRFFFHVFGALAEFETDLIRERTIAGLDAARARGRKGGRPKGLKPEQITLAKTIKAIYDKKEMTVAQIAKSFRIGRTTCYRYLNYINSNPENKR